jgi:O-Antigen ligase
MQLVATRTAAPARRLTARLDPPALAAWTLAFALVFYLALRGGGYDAVVRSEVGVAIWWIVLLAALAGIVDRRMPAAGWAAIGLLAAFAAWTGLAATWSESAERSATELGRVATHLGVLVLAIALQGRAAARHTIAGLACAIGLVSLLAVLSRLHPQWFPSNDHFEFLGAGSARKLSYPLNYWNALAAFAAIGVPLLLALAVAARTLAGQALAAAALPVCALCVYLTISRGGALAVAVALVAFLALAPRRLDALATLAVSGTGAAIVLWATSQRDALGSGVPSPAAIAEGDEMLWLLAIVCGGVALLQVAIGLAARHLDRPAFLAPGRRATALGALALLVLVTAVGVAAGAPGELRERWQDFKAPVGAVAAGDEASVFSRLEAANGNGRYEFWQAALDANATDPLKGIGPGAFELWWSRNATTPGFVRDAHTLYFETLAETGIVGAALLGALLLGLLCVAVARSLRASPELRVWIAAAAGGLAAFMTSAAFEWVWEMGAIAVAVMLLAAVIVAGREGSPTPHRDAATRREGEPAPHRDAAPHRDGEPTPHRDAAPHRDGEPAPAPRRDGSPTAALRRGAAPRAVLALLAIAGLAAVLVPLAGALAIRDSRAAAADGRLEAALADSRTAGRVQPYAVTPHLQRALLLESAGALGPAAAAARAATAEEPTNWRTWLVLARVDARRGAGRSAIEALRRARELNPYSTLLNPR